MVKTDDYYAMEEESSIGGGTVFDKSNRNSGVKGSLMIGMEDSGGIGIHANWLPQRSKSAGLKCNTDADYDESDESGGDGGNKSGSNAKFTPSVDGELDDRRLRRQIANCNERRRMQSINAGFQALRQLLPRKDGDKMSKAAILASTAEFIQTLLREKNKLLEENALSAKRRRLEDPQDNEQQMSPNVLDCLRTISELRSSLQKETQLRMACEKELIEFRSKMGGTSSASSFCSPGSDYSPNSSSSNNNTILDQQLRKTSAAGAMPFLAQSVADGAAANGLLIEIARQQQEKSQQQSLYHPTPIGPSEVQILSSAIASLAKASPTSATPNLMGTPIGIRNQQQPDASSFVASSSNLFMPTSNGSSLFGSQQITPRVVPTDGQTAQQVAPISQRNLQALVLAIRHLEGANNSGGSNPNNGSANTSAGSPNTSSSNDLRVR